MKMKKRKTEKLKTLQINEWDIGKYMKRFNLNNRPWEFYFRCTQTPHTHIHRYPQIN